MKVRIMDPLLTVVIPVRNEEKNISRTLLRLEKFLNINHETIVLNDYSTDKTKKIVEDFILKHGYKNVLIADNLFSAGLAGALKTGISLCSSDFFVFLMGDTCDSIGTIRDMFKKISDGYDLVCGSRYMPGGKRIGGSKLKAIFSWFVGKSVHFLVKIPTYDVSNNFKMYRKQAFESIDIQSKSFESALEIALKLYFKGYRITEVPTVWKEIRKGRSNFKMFKLAIPYIRWYLWGIGMKIKMEIKRCFTR